MFPQAQVQLCIVHQVRASLNYVSWKQRKAVAGDLQTIYRSARQKSPSGETRGEVGGAYPHRQPGVAPELGAPDAFFGLPVGHSQGDLHDQAVESLNMSLRKVIKTRGSFPTRKRR